MCGAENHSSHSISTTDIPSMMFLSYSMIYSIWCHNLCLISLNCCFYTYITCTCTWACVESVYPLMLACHTTSSWEQDVRDQVTITATFDLMCMSTNNCDCTSGQVVWKWTSQLMHCIAQGSLLITRTALHMVSCEFGWLHSGDASTVGVLPVWVLIQLGSIVEEVKGAALPYLCTPSFSIYLVQTLHFISIAVWTEPLANLLGYRQTVILHI